MSASAHPEKRSSWRPVAVLAVGAALGLALVLVDLLRAPSDDPGESGEGMVTLINGSGILISDYAAALNRYSSSKNGAMTAHDSTAVLEALIEEELLVQRAQELGVDRNDRLVRDLMAKTVTEMAAMEAQSADPAFEDVATFYRENEVFFAKDPHFNVREIRVEVNKFRNGDKALAMAQEATRRLRAGEKFETVARQTGDRPANPVPGEPLTEAELRTLLGAAATSAVRDLEPGEVSDPVRSPAGFHVVQLVGRSTLETPPLEEIEDQVRLEMRRRAQLEAIREYVAELRARSDIRILGS